MKTQELTAERLREVLAYDPETGDFRWLVRRQNVRAGSVAGRCDKYGYWRIGIDGGNYAAHRLAFLYMTGEFPSADVDHADCDKSNNRWANLRKATDSQNVANTPRKRSNTSGRKGVTWHKSAQKWQAQIKIGGRNIHLGLFLSVDDAHSAYIDAADKHFGQFARAA